MKKLREAEKKSDVKKGRGNRKGSAGWGRLKRGKEEEGKQQEVTEEICLHL